MSHLLLDPPDADRYLAGLNACFGHWGGAREWAWTFERDAGQGRASRLIATDEAGAWIAGSGVSWREAAHLGPVGIMTGSWTLPEARGRGCFTAFIRASSAQVAQRQGAALLAFVTETNASRRRLEASGAHMVPSAYARTTSPLLSPDPTPWLPATLDAPTLWQLHALDRADAHGFLYPTADAFAAQFLHRALPTTLLHDPTSQAWAIVEEAPDTDRLLFLASTTHDARALPDAWRSLAAHAGARGRKFFGFAVHPTHLQAVQDAKLDLIPGFLTLNRASLDEDHDPGPLPSTLPWSLQSGDRM
jgi:hypothetical protein